MKFIRLSFIIFVLSSVFWVILPHDKLPQILFPIGAQHNTLGELPIVEMADDGAFAEVDGKETEYAGYWCDELNMGFTCQIKFGMSYDVARRISQKKYLSSCEKAKKEASKTFDFCYSQIKDPSDFCYTQSLYLPECHGSYKDWLYEKCKGGGCK